MFCNHPWFKDKKNQNSGLSKLPKALILNTKWWSWGLPDFRTFTFNQLSYNASPMTLSFFFKKKNSPHKAEHSNSEEIHANKLI